MHRILTTLAVVLALAATLSAQDHVCTRGKQDLPATLYMAPLDLTGTWDCTVGAPTCTEHAPGTGNATALTNGDTIWLQSAGVWWSYEVDGTPLTDDSFERASVITGTCTGETTAETLRAVAASAASYLHDGLTATMTPVELGSGEDTPLSLSTTAVGVAQLETGGGFAGGSGCTEPGTGNLSCTGAIAGGSVTSGGVAVLTAESDPQVNTVTNGNFCKGTGTQVDCTDASTYLTAEAQTLAAVTALGATTTTAVALNGGLSVDAPAFTVADTTGAVSSGSTISAAGYVEGEVNVLTEAGAGSITDAEASQTLILQGAAGTLTLPDASANTGMAFTACSTTAAVFSLDPLDGSQFIITAEGVTLAGGFKLSSSGVINECVTLVSGPANYWRVVGQQGLFADGGA